MTGVGGAREGHHVGSVGAVLPRSGDQLEIEAGSFRAILTEVGATLRTFDAGGVALLGVRSEGVFERGRGQILAPLAKCLEDGYADERRTTMRTTT
jgi:aldose 1-epimerase